MRGQASSRIDELWCFDEGNEENLDRNDIEMRNGKEANTRHVLRFQTYISAKKRG